MGNKRKNSTHPPARLIAVSNNRTTHIRRKVERRYSNQANKSYAHAAAGAVTPRGCGSIVKSENNTFVDCTVRLPYPDRPLVPRLGNLRMYNSLLISIKRGMFRAGNFTRPPGLPRGSPRLVVPSRLRRTRAALIYQHITS
ncbi:hypothetical protein EVAR_65993_1 [Eumeta japonica]|uniref:Uncharacterized protein n=1 Tax=Eumeta variegata TaxID=151549 RepID=A0A4C1ZMQ5_EUMVA|nr:hypothetical protein EVAR_65993_1 [Eumeta japonica]